MLGNRSLSIKERKLTRSASQLESPGLRTSNPAKILNHRYKDGHGGLLEEFGIVGSQLVAQVLYGGSNVLMSYILSAGLKPLPILVWMHMINVIFITPLAITVERKKWPKKLTLKLMLQFVLIAGGQAASQLLTLMGIKKTSPAIASAMPNLGPGLIFINALFLGIEKFDIRCTSSKAKILGTLMCLTGAITMSLFQTPQPSHTSSVASRLRSILLNREIGNKDWLMGCLYLLSSVFVSSCSMVSQAVAMVEFPAPLSLCSLTMLIGAGLLAVVQLITEGNLNAGFPNHGIKFELYLLADGVVMSICIAFQAWGIDKRGPVFVSMFNPISAVCAAILTALILGQFINLASLAGMLILFVGLYIMLWVKKKEDCKLRGDDNGTLEADDMEKPFLR